MRTSLQIPLVAAIFLGFALCGQNARGQNTQTEPSQPAPASHPAKRTQQRSPGGDVGSGAGDVGKGTAKGAGAAAKGVGKGAGDLVTLHPVDAAGNVGKGAAVAGKDAGVGAVKGTGKIAKGTGRGVGKVFHHHHDTQTPDAQTPAAPTEPQN